MSHIQCVKDIRDPRKHDTEFCWTCGHYAQIDIGKVCRCCKHKVTKPKKHDRTLEIKQRLDELPNNTEAEYRFYLDGWLCWIKQSDLDSYQKLDSTDTHERYFHFIRALIDSDRLARVVH